MALPKQFSQHLLTKNILWWSWKIVLGDSSKWRQLPFCLGFAFCFIAFFKSIEFKGSSNLIVVNLLNVSVNLQRNNGVPTKKVRFSMTWDSDSGFRNSGLLWNLILKLHLERLFSSWSVSLCKIAWEIGLSQPGCRSPTSIRFKWELAQSVPQPWF